MVTGRCTNIMSCSKAKNKEIQEADKANFVCAECGKPLMVVNGTPPPPPPPGSWWKQNGKKVMIGAAAVAIIAIAIIFLMKNNGTQSEPASISPSNISLSKDKCEILVGETDTLQAILSPDGATAQLKWATSDTTIIKVVDGVVTAVSPGTAKVGVQVVENKKLKDFCEYTVTEDGNDKVDATVSIVPPASTTLNVSSSVTLSAKVTPEGNTLSWTSSDESVASVSAGGKVTAIKVGNVDITAHNGDAKDIVKIEVKDNDGGETGYNFTFGTYKGNMRNGVPHGEGNITITKTVTIDCNNLEGETITLHRGDKISRAEIRNGYLQSGYFKIGGNERYIDGLNKRLK